MTPRKAVLLALIASAALIGSCTTKKTVNDPYPAVVSGLSPDNGAIGGGTNVVVYGSGFADGAIVQIGDAWASSVAVVSETEISCVTPRGLAEGPADVTVYSPGRKPGTLEDGFTYKHWWNSAWECRKAVVVTGSTAGALADYQVRISITYDSDMDPLFEDLRFCSYYGGAEIPVPCWMESCVPGSQAEFWVKVPYVPASPATLTVYAYYGNASAADASDFDAVFAKEYGESGLLGLWHLDECGGAWVSDAAGGSNHGLLRNFAPPFGWACEDGGAWAGRQDARFSEGGMLLLDGSDDFVDCGAGTSLHSPAAMTLEAWVRGDRPSASGPEQVIAGSWQSQNSGFSSASSWTAFRAGPAPVNALGGYHGAGFDGQYVYFIPHYSGGYHGQVLRYDSHANFSLPGSWTAFDPGSSWGSAPPWTTAANNMLSPSRREQASAVVNGKIYVFGGVDGTIVDLNLCEEYDPASDTWAPKTAMPTARTEAAAAAIDGLIYVIGGEDYDTNTPLNTVEIYNPSSNSWTTGANMPTARRTLSCAAVNGRIYAIGGDDAGTTCYDVVEEYNPATNTWATKSPMGVARGEHGCAVLNGRIYIVSGWDGAANLASVEVYNPADDTWTTAASIPNARRHPGCEVLEGRILAVGGYTSGTTGLVEEYDPVSNSWRQRSTMSTARRDFTINAVGSALYVTGGINVSLYDTVHVYKPERDWVGHDPDGYMGSVFDGRYLYLVPYYNGSAQHGCVLRFDTQGTFNDMNSWIAFDPGWYLDAALGLDLDGYRGGVFDGRYVYFVPLDNGSGQHGAVLRFDTEGSFRDTGSWTAFDPGNAGVGTDPDGYQGAVFDGRYVYFSPFHNGLSQHGEVLRYDTQSEFGDAASWRTFDPAPGGFQPWPARANMPTARDQHGSVVYKNRIYCIGGANTYTANEEYNPAMDQWASKTAMPTPRGYVGCAVFGDGAYVIGGNNGPSFLTTVERYNFLTNNWTTGLAALPLAKAALRCSTLNGLIYAMGGYDGGNYVNAVYTYNPLTNVWNLGTPMITARGFFAHAVVDGKIYVFGGIINNAGTLTAAAEVFTPGTGWASLPPMPGGARARCSCAALGRNIYVISGLWSSGGVANIVEIYNTANNTWETSPHAASRAAAIAETVNGQFYVIGGSGPVANNNSYPEYDPAGFTGGVFDGRYVYFAPHQNQGVYFGGVLRYDTSMPFESSESWDSFDAGSFGVGADPDGFYGALSDGRFVYFVPYYNGLNYSGEFLRFDTKGEFRNPSSWSAVDVSLLGIGTDPQGYIGGVSDGKYLYFAPYHNGTIYHAEVLRYDTTGSDASFKLDWSNASSSGGFSGAPCGISAVVNTEDGAFTASSNAPLTAGGWHHAAMTYDGLVLSLYVDGALAGSAPASGDVMPCTAPFTIGGFGNGNSALKGSVDEVRLYGRALPAGEILAHAQRRSFAQPAPAAGAAGSEEKR